MTWNLGVKGDWGHCIGCLIKNQFLNRFPGQMCNILMELLLPFFFLRVIKKLSLRFNLDPSCLTCRGKTNSCACMLHAVLLASYIIMICRTLLTQESCSNFLREMHYRNPYREKSLAQCETYLRFPACVH